MNTLSEPPQYPNTHPTPPHPSSPRTPHTPPRTTVRPHSVDPPTWRRAHWVSHVRIRAEARERAPHLSAVTVTARSTQQRSQAHQVSERRRSRSVGAGPKGAAQYRGAAGGRRVDLSPDRRLRNTGRAAPAPRSSHQATHTRVRPAVERRRSLAERRRSPIRGDTPSVTTA